jgi:hypothetical protein
MLLKEQKYIKDLKTYRRKVMDIAELRNKLDSIAAELAEQDVQQEEIAIEEHHEKDEDGNVIPHDDISEEEVEEEAVEERSDKEEKEREDRYMDHDLYDLMIGGPADSGIAKLPRKNFKKEEEEVAEEEVEEAMIEVPVQELADIMQLAGYTDYAERIEEYANEPDEQYQDAEDQMIGLSGGLNGPKTAYAAAAGGDNPMQQEPTEIEEENTMEDVEDKLYRSYQAFLEENEIDPRDALKGVKAVPMPDLSTKAPRKAPKIPGMPDLSGVKAVPMPNIK